MNPTINHPLQSPAWGQFRKAMGIDVLQTHGWQLTFHKIPHTPWTIGYFPRGPLPRKDMIDKLIEIGKQKNAIFIQLEPNVLSGCQLSAVSCQLLRPSHHPLFPKYTFILDLTKSEEELLKNMHPKTRYNIKVAQKHGVAISNDDSPQVFKEYLRLTRETTQRQGFLAHNETYHRRMWDILSKAGIAKLWTATYQGQTIAAWIIFCWKDTIYYPYGSSSREHRDVMAPNLLLWEIIRWGKRQGYKKFDLWGALGPKPDQDDPWYGFHRFKEGYHPDLVEFIGSYDLVLQPMLYKLYAIADKLRWVYLNIRK
ncbi:peptidoglycan bridge formation glycyltransferase FemA/FemB family protein [Candidatus Gottesmanbacteria bacterium]|nr:peptidoglycan bridge formation glycyltransferase FemA/FemB family protein [Candidatus Gottesmanbacteria bacterium]